jgi:chorismate mutase
MSQLKNAFEVERVLRSMIPLIEELTMLRGQQDDEEMVQEDEGEVLDRLVEGAAERGVDEDAAEKFFRAMLAVQRKMQE